ncbi:MAG: bifunctional phosphopantothenoylcysteine decarboxylase/phosphopantothenate--cysteine ligase CoaBC, partial [Zetaproteobacteria bacterium]
MIAGSRILIAIGGGIAALRAVEYARALAREGAEVEVVMTQAAKRFMTPLAVQALVGAEPRSELFDPQAERAMGHIALARWPDAVLVMPATADLIARTAHGLADELATAVLLATRAPVVVVPAMNTAMWEHPATRRNLAELQARGVSIVPPEAGELACGEVGEGRMASLGAVRLAVMRALSQSPLAGTRWVITTGRTEEPWDEVRVLTNRATGRMGAMIAEQAAGRGAEVICIAGPGAATPHGAKVVSVRTAREMHRAALEHARGADVFVAAAAVSDYRPLAPLAGKRKRVHEAELI